MTSEPQARRLHWAMTIGCSAILSISMIGSRLTSLNVQGVWLRFACLAILLAMFAPIPAYLHQEGRIAQRDSVFVIPWCMVLAILAPLLFLAGARLRMPLQDDLFASIDHALHINVAVIVHWALQHHWVGKVFAYAYALLAPYLVVAIVLPALFNKCEAKHFVVANLIAFAIASPLFALFPAIGPWTMEHFPANEGQMFVQHQWQTLRSVGACSINLVTDGAAIVSFPSFHVIWAVLAASALWGFRRLRVLLVVLSSLIVFSTLTTGWHYFTDVLGGLVVAAISILAARKLLPAQVKLT